MPQIRDQNAPQDADDAKRELLDFYEDKAEDHAEDVLGGESERVPESKSAFYFIDRKVEEAMAYVGERLAPGEASDLRAMEIGCSFGNMTALLAKRFRHLTAVDLSPKSVELARRHLADHGLDHVTFVADDAERLERFEDGSFDVIFSFSALRYCPDVEAAIRRIRERLDEDGVAVIDFPNRYSPWHWLIKRLAGIERHIHDHLYSRREIIELMERTGFRDVEAKYFLFTTRRLPDALLPLFKVVDAVLERLPGVRALAGIIMVRGVKK